MKIESLDELLKLSFKKLQNIQLISELSPCKFGSVRFQIVQLF